MSKAAPEYSDLLTLREAAEFLRVHPNTLYRYLPHRTDIPYTKCMGHYRFSRRLLQEYLDHQMLQSVQ